MLDGHEFVTPQDIKAGPRRLTSSFDSYEAEAEGLDADALVDRLLSHVPVP